MHNVKLIWYNENYKENQTDDMKMDWKETIELVWHRDRDGPAENPSNESKMDCENIISTTPHLKQNEDTREDPPEPLPFTLDGINITVFDCQFCVCVHRHICHSHKRASERDERDYSEYAESLILSERALDDTEGRKMVKPILYYFDMSPPSRATRLTINALGLDVEYRHISTVAGEHLSPEFVKINPQHTVPTLDDNGKIIWDSHAICSYLVTKYGKDDSLYPTDPYVRAQIDQRLHFDTGVLWPRFFGLVRSVFYDNKPEYPALEKDFAIEAIQFLETFLGNNQYLVGNQLTLADFSCGTSASTLVNLLPVDEVQFPKVFAWLKRIDQLPYNQECNIVPGQKMTKFFDDKLKANRSL